MSYINREETIRLIDEYQGGAMDKPTARKILAEMGEGIVRCKDCRWWDRMEDSKNGYCHAAKHGHYSKHWEIRIYRTYKEDFFCSDAERREDDNK